MMIFRDDEFATANLSAAAAALSLHAATPTLPPPHPTARDSAGEESDEEEFAEDKENAPSGEPAAARGARPMPYGDEKSCES
jgi:hypothetical protein